MIKKLLLIIFVLTFYNMSAWADVLDGLKTQRPRLLMDNKRLEELKTLANDDKVLAGYADAFVKQADDVLGRAALERKLIGPRLLSVSVECLRRVSSLAFAYRWTGQQHYADKAIENMLTVAAFSDWNPSHFLDVAEMTNALALGYDWLYEEMNEEQRQKIRLAIVELGLKPGLELYNKNVWWSKSAFNWNQVCNGGMTMGALALAEEEKELASEIIAKAVASLPLALKSYEPDGLWMEGPGYWNYATTYTVTMLAALDSALGHNFELDKNPGLAKAVRVPILTAGPTEYLINYADSNNPRRRPVGCIFWLARRFEDKFAVANEHQLLKKYRPDLGHIIWYWQPEIEKQEKLDLDAYFGGPVELAVFRSAWDDGDALFAAIKAGYNQVAHGHLDLGAFELTALGHRWAIDLGRDDYNLPGYWESRLDGKRWKYYRLNSLSHNVPIIDNENQTADGKVKFLEFAGNVAEPYAILDLTDAYRGQAKAVKRTLKVIDNRRALVIKDEFELLEKAAVRWQMITPAKVELKGRQAILTLGDKQLIATVLQPEGAVFGQVSTTQQPPENLNEGTTQLVVQIDDVAEKAIIEILLEPQYPQKQNEQKTP